MTNLSSALHQLREERKTVQQHAERLSKAISMLEGLVGRNGSTSARKGTRHRRIMSASARKRIAAAQKARWAKWHQRHGKAARTNNKAPAKRIFSAATRRKMAAAQRARWATANKAA